PAKPTAPYQRIPHRPGRSQHPDGLTASRRSHNIQLMKAHQPVVAVLATGFEIRVTRSRPSVWPSSSTSVAPSLVTFTELTTPLTTLLFVSIPRICLPINADAEAIWL